MPRRGVVTSYANALALGEQAAAMEFGSLLPARMGESDGQEYWVDFVSGNNANPGTSIGSPKKTLDGGSGLFAALATTSSARIYLRNSGDHVLASSWSSSR